jgi:tetratricopeptide (TPR) repeat protein
MAPAPGPSLRHYETSRLDVVRAALLAGALVRDGQVAMKDHGGYGDALPEPPEMHQLIIHAERGSAVIAVLHGDMHIRNGHPVYQVMHFPMDAQRISQEKARQQPSRVLAAESQVVPFAGREQQLARLAFWRDDPASSVSVMLVHGAGGQGKTRLAARFATDCHDAGWTVWAAHHLSDPTAQHVVAPGDPGQGLVLIVDYADRWPVDDLLLLLNNPLLRLPQRARALLIARSAGPWWPSIRHRLGKAGLESSQTMRLPPLAETVSARRGTFVSARDAFANVFGTSASLVPVPEMMDGDAFHLVLTVHMAALVAVDAHRRGTKAPSDPVGLSAYLLDREHDFWYALSDHQQIAIEPTVMGRTVYTATLTHQLNHSMAVAALERIGVVDAAMAASALGDHAVCYPTSSPGTGTVLEPLYPDRLGEDFLALSTPGHDHPDYLADQWAEGAPARLLISTDQEPPLYSRPAVTALIETARRWPHIAERQLNPLLRERPRMAIAAGGAALAGIASLPSLDMEVLEAIESQLPGDRHVDLDVGIAALTARLTAKRLTDTSDAGQQASLYHELGKRLTYAGLFHEALAAIAKATEIRDQLVVTTPGTYEPDLALSLTNLGKALSDLGDNERASAATGRAVAVYRQLARTDQAAHEPGLARALNNLGADLSVLGRPDDALAAIGEAADIRRRLAANDPAGHEPDLALTVTNIGVILRQLGRREQALTASGHAVEIWRRLVADNPSAHMADLARALSNLAADLADAGRPWDALGVADQAVDVYRQLTRSNQAAHEPGLTTALSNLAAQLSALGRSDDALAVIKEVVGIRQRLASDNPAAHGPAVAAALDKYGVMLAGAGRSRDALAAIDKAVGIRQRLTANNLAAHEPALAESLNNLGKILSDSGHSKQALTAARRAAEIYRRLAASNPAAYEPALAMALGNLGMILLSPRRRRQALAATRESVTIFRRLALADQAVLEPGLARALFGFAFVRAASRKELQAALSAAVEAIQILQRLAAERPLASTEALLAAYGTAADVLDQLGDKHEAAVIRRLVNKASEPVPVRHGAAGPEAGADSTVADLRGQ